MSKAELLSVVYAYLDDITICGHTKEHDKNLEQFLSAVRKYSLTINESKSYFSWRSIKILGNVIEDKMIKPDPERLETLIHFPAPSNLPYLRRAIGMLAHYSKWIHSFSGRIHRLANWGSLSITEQLLHDLENLNDEILKSVVTPIKD
ncbi:hypothetical protein JTB14_025278 [Gonioctena quinquepunctata]|nr:hypothetical protein JTB14_025278 [Gonioctena quinquepunctata]